MSQRTFIDDVATWPADECRQKLHSAIPTLINSFYNDEKQSHDALTLILQHFAAVCEIHQLETLIFGKLKQQLCAHYHSILDDIIQLVTGSSQQGQQIHKQVLHRIQKAMSIVSGLEGVIQHVMVQQCEQQVHMEYLHSLLGTTLHVVQASFSHCKESSTVYGTCLGLVSEQLSGLFKKANATQMALVTVIDKMTLGPESNPQDLDDMAQVILGLHTIGEISASLDVKITVTLWKVVSRLAIQYKDTLQGRIDYSPVIQALCQDMITSYTYITQLMPTQQEQSCVNDKAFSKHLKILGFQMKILIKFVDEFCGELKKDCVRDLYKFVLAVNRYIPPSLLVVNVPRPYTDEIQKQFANGVEPLLAKLIGNHLFIQEVTREQEHNEDCQLPHCMALLSVSEVLYTHTAPTQERWLAQPDTQPGEEGQSGRSLLQAIFDSVKQCYVELSLPVTVSSDGKEVSLYEHIVIKTCALVATYPQQHFSHVECCLLENVLQPSVHSAILAIDVWCFIARYGSATLCKSHCISLTRLLLSSDVFAPSPQCCHLLVLVRRIVKFLAPENQAEYICTFPPASHLPLWGVAPLHAFSGDPKCQDLVPDIVSTCVSGLREWNQRKVNTVNDAVRLNSCIKCLHNTLNNPFIATEKYSTLQPHFPTLLAESVALLHTLRDKSVLCVGVLRKCVSGVLEVLASLLALQVLENTEILMVLQYIHWFIKECAFSQHNIGDNAKLAALVFLQNLGKKTLSPSNEQAQILNLLPRVFTRLLSDPSPIVQHATVQMFAGFAEETPHESVVPESLSADEQIQHQVVTYLNQLSNGYVPEPVTIKQLQLQKDLETEYAQSDLNKLYIPAEWPEIEQQQEPQSKRQKLEDINSPMHEDRIQAEVTQIKTSIHHLTQFSANHTLPDSFKSELKECYDILGKLL